MKFLLLTVLYAVSLLGSVFQVSDDLSTLQWQDQFEKNINIEEDTKQLIVVFSKDKGNELKTFFENNPNYLQEQKALYLADVSAAPSFVTSMFMIPKFKKYSYSMGLIRDEDLAVKFPKKEEMITIINLINQKIESIEYKKILP